MSVSPSMVRNKVKLLPGLIAVAVLASGCGSVRDQFIGPRIDDACNGAWNVCATTVGCFVGDRSYVEGRFPGTNKVGIQLFEPSEVTVSLLLFETAGAGETTVINFHEESCGSRVRVELTGRALTAENEQSGFVFRTAELSGVGDHLIEVESDSRTRYLMKVDVLPLRLRDVQ